MPFKTTTTRMLALLLVFALSLGLSGCGSLARILNQPDPPRADTNPVELTKLPRATDEYKSIEVFHGSWDEPQYSPDQKGYFYEERGWIYLHIEGSGAERGFQYGWLLADYLQLNINHKTDLLAELYALDWGFLRANADRMWANAVSDEIKAELEGMVQGATERGATFDYLDLLVLNGYEELLYCWFPLVQDEYYQQLARDGSGSQRDSRPVQPHIGYPKQASALIATGDATEEGDIVIAHNTLASYTDAAFANVLIDLDPLEGQRFTLQAEPGCIASFGEVYESASLLIANTRISDFTAYSQTGTPEFLRIRQAVQYAKTLDEFAEMLTHSNNGGLASTWLVGELKTGSIMKLELGLAFINKETLTNGCFASSGAAEDRRILTYETSEGNFIDARSGAGSRSVRLEDLSDAYTDALNEDSIKIIIADHYDQYLSKVAASSRSVCAHFEADDARYSADLLSTAYLPYGTVDAKVMSTGLAKEHTILARWGSACGRAFDATGYLEKNPQYRALEAFLYDRPSQFWNEFYPKES
ncbi:MAG: hypothetical protein LBP91_03880 [Coriobacteriales bacterium]|jgi:hypothetical protein|nr:hypothetical protein [Coriobacteriales bacterium]